MKEILIILLLKMVFNIYFNKKYGILELLELLK
jgi:hypothetical protein